jgi:hypothetical protein
MSSAFQSLPGLGRKLGFGARWNLITKVGKDALNVTQPCVNVTGTISAEGASVANQRDITLTFKDAEGRAINYAEMVEIIVFTSSAMTDFAATGGSTGIAAGASGKLLAVVAKKVFKAITTTAGVLSFIYTDTGTEAVYLGVRLPNGRVVGIGTLTNA